MTPQNDALEQAKKWLIPGATIPVEINSIRVLRDALEQALSQTDQYHRFHEIHEGQCVTCYMAQKEEAEKGWRPIESAPRDGTWVIGWWPHMQPCIIFYDHGEYESTNTWVFATDSEFGEAYPTHFMPLPAPPTVKEKE